MLCSCVQKCPGANYIPNEVGAFPFNILPVCDSKFPVGVNVWESASLIQSFNRLDEFQLHNTLNLINQV